MAINKRILNTNSVHEFEIHPAAKEAYEMYSHVDNLFFRDVTPTKTLLTTLNDSQVFLLTTKEIKVNIKGSEKKRKKGFIFSGFANVFFNINDISPESILVEIEGYNSETITNTAWEHVFLTLLSQKDFKVRAKIIEETLQKPESLAFDQFNRIYGSHITQKQFSKLSGISEQGIIKQLKALKATK